VQATKLREDDITMLGLVQLDLALVLVRRLRHPQLGSNRPSPEQGLLVVWAFFF
jgi:hypothetical protein